MYATTIENKKLKATMIKTEENTKDQRHMSNYTIESLEKILAETINKNNQLVSRI